MHVRIYRTFPQLFQNRLEEPFNVMVCRVCKKTVGVSAVKKNTNTLVHNPVQSRPVHNGRYIHSEAVPTVRHPPDTSAASQ